MKRDGTDSRILEILGKKSLTSTQLTHLLYPDIPNQNNLMDKDRFVRNRLKDWTNAEVLRVKKNSDGKRVYSIPRGNIRVGDGIIAIKSNGRIDKHSLGKTIGVKSGTKGPWLFLYADVSGYIKKNKKKEM